MPLCSCSHPCHDEKQRWVVAVLGTSCQRRKTLQPQHSSDSPGRRGVLGGKAPGGFPEEVACVHRQVAT